MQPGRILERYAVQRGAQSIVAGGFPDIDPFYLGLYGGCLNPGVMDSDELTLGWLQAVGYLPQRECVIYHRQLTGFRPPVDRTQMQIRRQFHVEAHFDPPTEDWWSACTIGWMNITKFVVSDRQHPGPAGEVCFWDMEPLANHWGVHAMGVLSLDVKEHADRNGITTFLLGESMRQLQDQQVSLIEVQTDPADAEIQQVLAGLGFEQVEFARHYGRDLTNHPYQKSNQTDSPEEPSGPGHPNEQIDLNEQQGDAAE